MAEKVITLKVDLSYAHFREKMEKILKKYQDKWKIKKVDWDTKNNKVTLSGPFNTDDLIKELCLKAVEDIIISDSPPSPPHSHDSHTRCSTGKICHCGPCHANQKQCNCDCSTSRKPCRCNGGYWLNYPPYPAYLPSYPPYPPYPPYLPAYGRPTCECYCEGGPSACVIM